MYPDKGETGDQAAKMSTPGALISGYKRRTTVTITIAMITITFIII